MATTTITPIALTIAQAAEALGCSQRKIYYLIKHHGLPARKVGSSLRIPAKLLAEWVEAQPAADAAEAVPHAAA